MMQMLWTKVNACGQVETLLIHPMLHLRFIHPHQLFPCGELQGKFFSLLHAVNHTSKDLTFFSLFFFGDSVISLLHLLTTPMPIQYRRYL